MNDMKIKSYSELKKINSLEERFEYLSMDGIVGEETFGYDRYLNQKFYKSKEWAEIKNKVILRDNACDLGIIGEDIYGPIIVHHMNPITKQDIINRTDFLKNPEYLICTSSNTHQAIHYGKKQDLDKNKIKTRTKNDHCPWKKGDQ